MEIQQHDGVMVEVAGFQQGFAKRCGRRERGRAAPKERRSHVLGSPKPQLYIGGKGLRPL